jgi:hypothetical protein
MFAVLFAALCWLAAIALVAKAVAVWRRTVPGLGSDRTATATAVASLAVALIFTAIAVGIPDEPGHVTAPLAMFAVGLGLLLLAFVLLALVTLFNRPRFVVPPCHRGEPGRVKEWRRPRSRR